jgi:hypothetical protein
MQTFQQHVAELVKAGAVSAQTARALDSTDVETAVLAPRTKR